MGDSDVFIAERIVNKRAVNGVTQYCIKWKGFSAKHNTWEPVDHILDPGLLATFEKKPAKKTKRSSTNSSNRSRTSLVKDSDDRENSEENPPASTSSSTVVASTVGSPRLDPTTTTSTSVSSPSKSPSTPRATPIPKATSTQSSANAQDTIFPIASTPKPKVQPSRSVASESPKRQNVNSKSSSPIRISSTPNCVEMDTLEVHENNVTANSQPNSSRNNKRNISKFAIMSTVITDVTVNDQTITISESKTNQGFFREVTRHSVAVDTTNSANNVD